MINYKIRTALILVCFLFVSSSGACRRILPQPDPVNDSDAVVTTVQRDGTKIGSAGQPESAVAVPPAVDVVASTITSPTQESAPVDKTVPLNAVPRISWYMDRSGSMAGFRQGGELESFLDDLLDKTVDVFRGGASKLSDSSKFYSIRESIVQASSFENWHSDRHFGGSTNLNAAFFSILDEIGRTTMQETDIAVVISDGFPSPALGEYPPCTTNMGKVSIENAFDFDKIGANDLSMWLGIVPLQFRGTRFLECSQAEGEVKPKVRQDLRNGLSCGDGKKECVIRGLNEKAPLAVFLFCSPAWHDRCETLAANLITKDLEKASMNVIQLWPPMVPEVQLDARQAWRDPVNYTYEQGICSRVGTDAGADFGCDLTCYADEFMFFESVVADASSKDDGTSAGSGVLSGFKISYDVGVDDIPGKGSESPLRLSEGNDFIETDLWLMAGGKTAGSLSSECPRLLESMIVPEADAVPDAEKTRQGLASFRGAAACSCLAKLRTRKTGSFDGSFAIDLVASRRFTPANLEGTWVSEWSADSFLLQPERIYGLQRLLESILQGQTEMANKRWGQLSRTKVVFRLSQNEGVR